MAAICGIVSLDGTPVSQDDFALMISTLSHHGAAQAQRTDLASMALLSGEIKSDRFAGSPLSQAGQSDNLIITATARIDNSRELFPRLEIPPAEQSRYSDCNLILASYEKWGETCPEFLLGDFAFAIWDRRRRRLVCCRDHMGISTLFYHSDARRFIFSSEPKAILANSGVKKAPNLAKIAALAVPEARPLFWRQSWFESIYSLPAGTSLTVDDRGVRERKYWEPALGTALPYRTDEEILEAFQSLMFEVVRARLPNSGPVHAMLSGGLDSSAIVSVAAKLLARESRELSALAVVLPDDKRDKQRGLSDERNFIDEFRAWPNIKINYITADSRGPFDNLDELVWGYDSPSITSRHYLYSALTEAARADGGRLILDGSGGELGPTWSDGAWYAELLLTLRWPTLWRELCLQARVYGRSRWNIFRSDALHPLLPSVLLEWRHAKACAAEHQRRRPLQAQFVKAQLAGFPPRLSESKRPMPGVYPNHRRSQQQNQLTIQQKAVSIAGYVGYGPMEMSYPFMDKRLLEFCLAVPGDLKVRDGYQRYLIRGGLDKTLPPAIQWRISKQPFSPDYLHRYNAQRKQAQTILAEIRPNDPVRAVVDIERMKQLAALPVADNERGTLAEFVALDSVPAGIYLICFLRRFAGFHN